MKLTLLSAADLRRALPMADTVEAMKDAFADFSTGAATVPQRLALPVPPTGAVTLFKPAHLASGALGAKIVSVFPKNRERQLPIIHGIVVLLDPETGEPQALCDGTFLTAWRTGAASGAATDLLAAAGARTLALLGCGVQARTQALAVAVVRDLDEVRVWARTRSEVERFASEMAPRLGCRVVAAASAREAVEDAEIICAATTSRSPVFEERFVRDGAHINGVGSFTAEMQEIDVDTVARSRVFVDSQASALAEAGDLVIAERAGRTDRRDWTELGEVVAGRKPGRLTESEVTFFKSVGVAVQDVKACALALERARRLGLGTEVEL